MSGNQKLIVFNLAIIFPIFVLTIIFPIFVLAGPRPRDGSSPDLDLKDTGRPWNSSDASTLAELFVNSTSRLFNANEGDDPLGSPEVEGNLDLPPAFFIDADGPFDPATGLLIKPDQVSLKRVVHTVNSLIFLYCACRLKLSVLFCFQN